MPARRTAASNTVSEPASAPVWDAAALAAPGVRPALTTMTGLLRDAARAAWEAYLQVDGTSAWASEARQHLASSR